MRRRVRQGRQARRWSAALGVASVVALLGAGCAGDDNGTTSRSTTSEEPAAVDGAPPDASPLGEGDRAALAVQVGDGTCDELDATRCLLPFPSDRFTVSDPDTDTGLRVALPAGQLANAAGTSLDPTEWNRNDGFSPGSPMMAVLPGVDLPASNAASLGDLARSLNDDSPTAVVDLTTGDRLAHWAELDAKAGEGQTPMLILRAAAALPEGHEIGVAVRSLVDSSGTTLAPSLAFRVFRDNLTTDLDPIENRRASMESLFSGLADAGVERGSLQLAWSFTVASAASIAGPLLAVRDDAFERLGSAAPTLTVTEVLETGLPPGIARRVNGRLDVPLYLDGTGDPGARLLRDGGGQPQYSGSSWAAYVTCQIPSSAFEGPGGHTRAVVYGHGLMGGAGESENGQVAKIASTNDMMYCATDWIGMTSADIGNVAAILQDMSKFPSMSERGLQGILNTLFMARAMKHSDGFGALPAFQNAAGESVIDSAEVYFDGNSQGHIMGGAATAVSQEWTKAVLGVGGMNYSLLLDRSVDFDSYFALMRTAYPDRYDQLLLFGIIQMLWDRIEGNGYAQHLTDDPYPDTPKHQVLLHVGFGDHQVPTWAAEIQARTIGAAVHQPALADGRHPDADPFFGLQAAEYPSSGSVLVYWDSGTLPAPSTNLTPEQSTQFATTCGALNEDERELSRECADSHEDPRRAPGSIEQKNRFLRPDGKIEDVCDAKPCAAPNRFTLDY